MGDHMSEADKRDPHNSKLTADNFQVPANRGCTDILFLLAIIAMWFGMTLLGLIVVGAIENPNLTPGNPQRLLAPIDYAGRMCGISAGVKDRPKGYFLPSASFVCVDACPTATSVTSFYCAGKEGKTTLTAAAASEALSNNTCMFQLKSKTVLSYCVPLDTNYQSAFTSAYGSSFNGTLSGNPSNYLTDLVGDFMTAKEVILGFGIGIAAVLGFLYLLLLQIPGVLCLLVWGILIAVLACLAGLGLFTIYTADLWSTELPATHSKVQIQAITMAGYVCYALAGLWFCFLVFMRKRISLAVAVIKEASRAVGYMKALIFYPLLQTVGLAIFLVPWILYTVYLMSSGEFQLKTATYKTYSYTYKEFTYTSNQRYAQIFLLFAFFWTSEFIIALGQIVVAMAVSTWYFTRDKSSVGSHTVFRSIRMATWYHTGTAAFGSLVIAIIKTIRAIIAYIQKKAAASKNRVLQMVLCCIQCCLWCFEKCMKFLNKNAYIQTAIYGTSFCMSAKKAFFLILRNILRIAAVTIVGDFVLLLGKLLIPVATTLMAYVVMQLTYGDDLKGLVGPLIIVAILSWFTANLFNEVYGMAISSILMCFLADEEMFKPEERFCEGSLADTIAHVNKKAAKSTLVSPLDDSQAAAPAELV